MLLYNKIVGLLTKDGKDIINIKDANSLLGVNLHLNTKETYDVLKEMNKVGLVEVNNRRVIVLRKEEHGINSSKPQRNAVIYMKRGALGDLIPILIGFMVVVIVTFNVVLPTLNQGIQSSAANLSGYTGATTTAQQLPLLTVVVLIVTIAAIIMYVMRRD